MQEAVNFLRNIYGDLSKNLGTLVITTISKWEENDDGFFKKRKRALVDTFKYPLNEIEEMDWSHLVEANENKADIYFGLALRKKSFMEVRGRSRGSAEQCSLSPALALDIDFLFEGAHSTDALPPDLDSVSGILDTVGPVPSMAVDSGYGIHLYWNYSEPFRLSGSKLEVKSYNKRRIGMHKPYRLAMKAKGWHLDSTHTLDRIWRLPGFYNWKVANAPRLITVLFGMDDPVAYDLEELSPRVEPKKKTKELAEAPEYNIKKERPLLMSTDVSGLPEAIKRHADRYYEDYLEESKSSDEDAQEIAEKKKQKARYLERLLDGESIEVKGNRDFALTTVCGIISYLTRGIAEFSDDDLEYIVHTLMRPSLEKWVEDSDDDTDIEREMEKALDKLVRTKDKDYGKHQGYNLLRNNNLLARRARRAERKAREELDGITEEQDPDEAEEELKEGVVIEEDILSRGIIIHNDVVYIWDWPQGRYYKQPVKSSRYYRAVLRDCWPEDDDTCPFKVSFRNDEDKRIEIPTPQLELLYSSAAEDCYYSFNVEQTCFDAESRSFIINPAPRRFSEELFNQDIDEWLKALGGDGHYDTLCDWLAGLLYLDKPCAALYLNGPPGCGKSLFAVGAAQLWADRPPLFEHIVRGFNGDILQAPVCLVDEGVQDVKNASMLVRRLLTQDSHSVNIKHGSLLRLNSFMRLVIAANNDEVLLSGREEKLSENDARAMNERIIYIEITNDDARNFFIKKNKGHSLTNTWIKGGAFAKHVLWLGANRDLSGRGRYLVEGNDTNLRNKFLFQGDERNLVLEWVVRFAEAPLKIQSVRKTDAQRKGVYAAEIGDGMVAICTTGMQEQWGDDNSTIPHHHLLRHLKSLSPRTKATQIRVGDQLVRYWLIPIELVIDYASSNDIGDIERIKEFSLRETDITGKVLRSNQK